MGTRYAGSPAEVRALDTYIKLLRAAGSVSRRARASVEAAGLTESRFGVLEALLHLGPLAAGELADKILRSAGNLTLVIDNLERDGLVERRSAPDRRRRPVALTPRGRALIARLFPGHVARIVAALRALTAREQDILAALCRKLGRSLEADPGPGRAGHGGGRRPARLSSKPNEGGIP